MDPSSFAAAAAAGSAVASSSTSSASPSFEKKKDVSMLLKKLGEVEQTFLAFEKPGKTKSEKAEIIPLICSEIASIQSALEISYAQRLADGSLTSQWLHPSHAGFPSLVYPTVPSPEYYYGSAAMPPMFGSSMPYPMTAAGIGAVPPPSSSLTRTTAAAKTKTKIKSTASAGASAIDFEFDYKRKGSTLSLDNSETDAFQMASTDAFRFRQLNPRRGAPPASYVCHRCGGCDHFVENCGSKLNLDRKRAPPPASYVCHKCNVPGHWVTECTITTDFNFSGAPPATYTCHRCGIPGHWIKFCPLSTDPLKIRR